MKFLLAVLTFSFFSIAQATDYVEGQCGVPNPVVINYVQGTNQWTSGTAGPGPCDFHSGSTYAATFSDTMTFSIGTTNEPTYNPPGAWVPESTQSVTATDGGLWVGGGRGGARHFYYYTIIDSASIDGTPLNPPMAGGHTWTVGANLAPGSHELVVNGHGSGIPWIAPQWSMSVQGMMSVLVAGPASTTPPPSCGTPSTPPCDD
jgi:hypothetical protein